MDIQVKPPEEKSEKSDFQVIDKRHFLNIKDIDIDKTAVEEKPRYPSYVEELMGKMAETERRFAEKKEQIDQEISRTRTRLETDFQRQLDLEKQKIVLPFLEVLDNLQRAITAAPTGTLEHLLEGVQMTVNQFLSKLQALGVEPIRALNEPFDPNLAQAIGIVKVADSGKDGVVVEEVQPGYSLDGQLLRPAHVRVGKLEPTCSS
jgi:molecular chaperone GrpE (heat shock protein)